SRVQVLFDYTFYRIFNFFRDRGDGIPETAGTLLLSLMQFLTILDIMVIVKMIHDYPFPDNKYFFLALLILLGVMNWFIYERNFDIGPLDDKWKDEKKNRKVRNGWLIGLYLVLSFLFPIVYGYLN